MVGRLERKFDVIAPVMTILLYRLANPERKGKGKGSRIEGRTKIIVTPKGFNSMRRTSLH